MWETLNQNIELSIVHLHLSFSLYAYITYLMYTYSSTYARYFIYILVYILQFSCSNLYAIYCITFVQNMFCTLYYAINIALPFTIMHIPCEFVHLSYCTLTFSSGWIKYISLRGQIKTFLSGFSFVPRFFFCQNENQKHGLRIRGSYWNVPLKQNLPGIPDGLCITLHFHPSCAKSICSHRN